MKFKEKIKRQFERAKRFILLNIWVQKFRIYTFKWWYLVDVIQRLVSNIAPLVSTVIIGNVINIVQNSIETGTAISLETIYPLVALGIGVNIISRIISTVFWQYDWYYSNYDLERRLEDAVIEKLESLNWEHIENPQTEKQIRMTLNRSQYHIRSLGKTHLNFIAIGISLIFAVIAANIHPIILLLIVVKEIPGVITQAKLSKSSHLTNDKLHNSWSRMNWLISAFRYFNSLMEVRVSNSSEQLIAIKKDTDKYIRNEYLSKDKKFLLPAQLSNIFQEIIGSGITIYYLNEVISNGMKLGTFQIATGLISQISGKIFDFLNMISSSINSYYYISYAYDMLNMQNVRENGKEQLNGDHYEIEFRNVWFKYPESKKYALKNINLKIKDNARLALVGENGAGKSTLLKLLMMLYYPTKGDILINGIPQKEIDPKSLYKHLAVVTQEFNRYGSLPAWQNIAILDAHKKDMKKIRAAAKLASADDVIMKLPNQYDTLLSKTMEGGEELSTGQWQRIAVARQFYSDRPIVILDEPTSAIDPIAESNIFNNLYHHVKDKTVIVVSHRYNTVRAAQQILVFKDGQIIERGTHEDLVSEKGYYAKAFEMQNESKKL